MALCFLGHLGEPPPGGTHAPSVSGRVCLARDASQDGPWAPQLVIFRTGRRYPGGTKLSAPLYDSSPLGETPHRVGPCPAWYQDGLQGISVQNDVRKQMEYF